VNVLEKVARLERLLAKVRQNGVRRPTAGTYGEGVQLVVYDELPSGGGRSHPEPPLLRAVESRERMARFVAEDRWEPPLASGYETPAPHVDTLPPPYEVPRPAELEVPRPAPLPSDGWARTEVDAHELEDDSDEEVPPALLDIERAVLRAVHRASSPSRREPDAFWADAAAELAPRPADSGPPASQPPASHPAAFHPPASHPPEFRPSESELRPSLEPRSRRRRSFRTLPPRRRPVKPASMVVKIHGGLAAVGVLGVVAVIWVALRSSPSTGAVERPEPHRSESARTESARKESPRTESPRTESAPPAPREQPVDERVPTAPEPAPTAIAEDQARLLVRVADPRYVFVNGRRIGESGAWLTVACGWRHVRLAMRGPPPPGESFPQWVHEGHSVLIPCGEATEISLAESE
jgi:hypothetical protein